MKRMAARVPGERSPASSPNGKSLGGAAVGGAALEGAALEAVDDRGAPHRAEALVLSFLGTFVLQIKRDAIPARVFIEVLGELGVGEGAVRRVLARMVERGLLLRELSGRNMLFAPSAQATAVLAQGAERVGSPAPFGHADSNWTLLAFTMPESRRDLRHQLRSRLLWAGFGPLRDGLWIAPGSVDVEPLLADLSLDSTEGDLPWAFAASPLPPTQLALLIRRVWDVGRIREDHERFLARWSAGGPDDIGPMAARTLLVADWLRLLRTDPGLPTQHLSPDWPAEQSARTYNDVLARLRPASGRAFEAALARGGPVAVD
jgi:DNA-binding transcriptional regulator PaaX